MQNFGNHMKIGTSHRSDIGQRTERIKHIGIEFQFQFQERTRHNQLRGSHKVYFYSQIFYFFCMKVEQIKNVLNKISSLRHS